MTGHHGMNRYAWLALPVLTVMLSAPAAACGCLWQGSFVEAIENADLVVSGQVVASSGNSFDIDIDEVLHGDEFREQIRIWGHLDMELAEADRATTREPGHGDPGQDALPPGRSVQAPQCRADTGEFTPGSQWVLALQRIDTVPAHGFNPDTPNISYGRPQDYALSQCGVYWLARDDSVVSGNILQARRWEYRGTPNPVLLYSLLADYLRGETDRDTLEQALRKPDRQKTRQLMDQTREFLRQQ